ncbi:phosphodiester glycosidase family protein, partial [Clostridium sp.]|uniref:phosphodiester glycosidase family protein n=1 Tax=Clostridium sp. TaxID=1506 RepID=UPI0028402BAF
MNTNKNANKSKNINKKIKLKGKKQRIKKIPFKVLMAFLGFELLFTACTAPFLLLYGPFENAKRTYVGAAMTSMSHQYLAKMFLSDAKIQEIIGTNETTNETTNTSEIQIPKVKDETIEYYKIENEKYTGHYLVIKDPTRVKIGYTSKLKVEGETTSQIAQNNNAIAAINGGGFTDQSSNQMWTGNGGLPIGVIMSGGKVIYNDLTANQEADLLAINKEGVMLVGKYSVEKLQELGVQEALSFGPS